MNSMDRSTRADVQKLLTNPFSCLGRSSSQSDDSEVPLLDPGDGHQVRALVPDLEDGHQDLALVPDLEAQNVGSTSQHPGASVVENAPPDPTVSLLALDNSVVTLKVIEKKMKKVDSKMAYSEQKANKVIESLGNRIGFILSYSGAWIFYEHIHLSCAIAGLITFVSLLSLFRGLAIAIWAAREELKRMIPAIENLDQEEKQLVKEVKVIKTKEDARKNNTEGMVNNDRLHAEVQCDAVVSRCGMIMNSKNYMCRFERYNRLFIWAAICCVIFNGACICCVAYFTYCRVAALRCTNPMMPLPGESAHMFNNDVIQNVPATIVDNASEFRYQVSLGDGVPQLCPVASISSVELAPHFVPVLAPTMEGGPCSSSFDSEFLHPEFCSETVAEEAHNGAGPEKEATQNALVFTAVKPQLFVKAAKAKDAVQFYKHAFGAEEVGRVNHPKRKVEQETPLILSVELKIGSSIFVVSDLTDEDSSAPVKTALTGYVFYLETVDVSSATAKAIAAGAIAEIKAEDGGADGGQVGVKLIDPYGNVLLVCSPVKESE